MLLREGVTKNFEGAVVITSRLGPAMKRAGWEKKVLLPSIEVGLPGWERSHSQGPGTGKESIHGIVYAPQSVNQHLQRLGIERRLKELVGQAPPGVELWLVTETLTHEGTDRLKEINYRVAAVKAAQQRILFELDITVGSDKVNPRVTTGALPLALSY